MEQQASRVQLFGNSNIQRVSVSLSHIKCCSCIKEREERDFTTVRTTLNCSIVEETK